MLSLILEGGGFLEVVVLDSVSGINPEKRAEQVPSEIQSHLHSVIFITETCSGMQRHDIL